PRNTELPDVVANTNAASRKNQVELKDEVALDAAADERLDAIGEHDPRAAPAIADPAFNRGLPSCPALRTSISLRRRTLAPGVERRLHAGPRSAPVEQQVPGMRAGVYQVPAEERVDGFEPAERPVADPPSNRAITRVGPPRMVHDSVRPSCPNQSV